MGSLVKRRLLWWALGAGAGCALPVIGFGFLLFLVIVVFFMVFGGLGFQAQKTPPPLPTQAVYSAQWLLPVQRVAAQNGLLARFPPVLWIAAMQSASGGMPLNRTTHGGYGLYDLPHTADMGQPLTAMSQFATVLEQSTVPQNLQATLNRAGLALKPHQSNWSQTVRSTVTSLEQGPQVVAWPVITDWGRAHPIVVGGRGASQTQAPVVWIYPRHQRIDVVATAAAPVGNPFSVAWTPPVRVCQPMDAHLGLKPRCHLVTDNITGRNLLPPVRMTLTTHSGQHIAMVPVQGPNQQDGFVFNQSVLYVTMQRVLVNASHPVTITAQWSNSVKTTTHLPGSGFGASSSGPVGIAPGSSNPKTVAQIWRRYGSDIRAAAQQYHIPVAPLVSEAYWESRGVAFTYINASHACGVWQMFSPGSFTAFAAPGTPPQACDIPRIEAQSAAAYLAQLYGQFGSWREAIAGYYGGAGTVQNAGVTLGTPWSQAVSQLNFIPAPGNTITMSAYAQQSYTTAQSFNRAHHFPPLP